MLSKELVCASERRHYDLHNVELIFARSAVSWNTLHDFFDGLIELCEQL